MDGWSTADDAPEADLRVVSEGVFAHGRAQAADGRARPIACLLRDGGRVVAGAVGRTEYGRLFVQSLWVEASRRGRGLGTEALSRLEQAAAARGCADALIETLDDRVAALYRRVGYGALAVVPGYVGPFNRHILRKALAGDTVRPTGA